MTQQPKPGASGTPLKPMLDVNHPLVVFTEQMEWETLCATFETSYIEDGRPSVPVRVLVGLHYLKTLNNESDEGVVQRWVENPYWQYVCGCDTFQHKLPCHPSSLSRWRKRVGEAGIERMFRAVLETALKVGAVKRSEFAQVTVDTTVQEKAIAFPTDARLYQKARRSLVREAKAEGIKLRQTYAKAGQRALFKSQRYGHAKQFKRAQRETAKLRTLLGRVQRDVARHANRSERLKQVEAIAQKIHDQKRTDSPKLYSVHAPEVECIAKGKAHKRYEFGCKVSFAATTASNWLVGVQALHENPYDGATLKPALEQVQRITGQRPTQALVDLGYRGAHHHPADVKVIVANSAAKATAALRQLFRRRPAIEPLIGHTKADHGMARNHLLGRLGDKIQALLCGCGFNLGKLLHALAHSGIATRPAC